VKDFLRALPTAVDFLAAFHLRPPAAQNLRFAEFKPQLTRKKWRLDVGPTRMNGWCVPHRLCQSHQAGCNADDNVAFIPEIIAITARLTPDSGM
jgi:hypothetical protein